MISFNTIPNNVRIPFVYIEFDNSNANQGAGKLKRKIAVLGQGNSDKTTLNFNNPERITSYQQAINKYGDGAMLSGIADKLFLNNNFTEAYFFPLQDHASGTAATKTLTITANSVKQGTISLYIAGKRVLISVTEADAANAIAQNIANTITNSKGIPFTSAANTNVVTLTCKWKGITGNFIDVRLNYYPEDETPEGITIAINNGTNGANNPDISDALANFADEHYTGVILPYLDSVNVASWKQEAFDRFGAVTQKEVIAYSASQGTLSSLSSLNFNSQFMSVMDCNASPSPPWEWAAAITGVAEYQADIDPARPFQTLTLQSILPAKMTDRRTFPERNSLLYAGIATHSTASDGSVKIERLITTYVKNAAGADDSSYLDVNTFLTLSFIRYDQRNYILSKYPRHKLADDGRNYGPGQAVVTPKAIKAEIISRYKLWMEMGLVENLEQFKKGLIVERNISDPNRLDVLMTPDLINQLRILGAKIAFLLQSYKEVA